MPALQRLLHSAQRAADTWGGPVLRGEVFASFEFLAMVNTFQEEVKVKEWSQASKHSRTPTLKLVELFCYFLVKLGTVAEPVTHALFFEPKRERVKPNWRAPFTVDAKVFFREFMTEKFAPRKEFKWCGRNFKFVLRSAARKKKREQKKREKKARPAREADASEDSDSAFSEPESLRVDY